MNPAVAQVVVGVPVEGPFDYLIPAALAGQLAVGARVLVRFAGRKRVGIVVDLIAGSRHEGRLSTLIKVLDEAPVFSPAMMELSRWFADRFACSRGEALELFLPAYLREAKTFSGPAASPSLEGAGEADVIFDRGQTRRWDVIVPRVAQVLGEGRGVLVLLPDASRCPDVLPKLGPLAAAQERALLTRGTDKEEYQRWLSVRTGTARLAVGFISAVFAPVRDLGLIVVLEEDSEHYRPDQSPFYHARDVALRRAELEGCDVLFVSSAPSVELLYRAQKHHVRLTTLDEDLPPVRFLDLTNFKMKKGSFLSLGLRHHLEAQLKGGGKVLLYIQAARGVDGIIAEVKAHFHSARVAGYDKSSKDLPEDFDILVATQAVLRHRGRLRVAVTAVLDIDWEFHKHDHQASHGAFALVQHLRQVTKEYLLMQTRQAADPLLHALAADDPVEFYRRELALREETGLPPFAALVMIIVRSMDPQLACAEAKRLYDKLLPLLPEGALMMEPQPDRTAIARGKFRFCLSLHGPQRPLLVTAVRGAFKGWRPRKDTVVTVDVA